MVMIHFVAADGNEIPVEVGEGETLMQAALMHGVDGITGECGGSAMCATCHCFVEEPWASKLDEMSEVEDEMLNSAASARKPTSRLSCQLIATSDLDGARVLLPEKQ